MDGKVKLIIPSDIDEAYNHAFFEQKTGDNTLIGYSEQLQALHTVMHNPISPIAMLVGRQGVGKTALVEQFVYDCSLTDKPVVVVGVNLEKLGEFTENVFVSKIRSLLTTMRKIEQATRAGNVSDFRMILFIDEIHKLAFYGENEAGSRAMNALKEEMGRGMFPMIGATTKYEFETYLKRDMAFTRRFNLISMKEPSRDESIQILKRLIPVIKQKTGFVPFVTDRDLGDLIDYANAYIWNQANPAKSISIFGEAVGLCSYLHGRDRHSGIRLDHDVLKKVFSTHGVDIDAVQANEIKIVIPPELAEKYNYALIPLKSGNGSLIGYQEQSEMLDATLQNKKQPNAMLLGEQGIGKTALVEHGIYRRSFSETKLAVVSLSIETLGALGSDLMVARLRTLLSDLNEIKNATERANPGQKFDMVLFIDEVHKLRNYGAQPTGGSGSSGAMNALKESLARSIFPVICATTDYEYRANIVPDPAFDRRFGKIIMEQPDSETTVEILRRFMKVQDGKFMPSVSDDELREIVTLTDAYIRNQVNPSKSLDILDKAIGFCRQEHQTDRHTGTEITHIEVAKAFNAEGYEIDIKVSPEHVQDVCAHCILGQPLALRKITDVLITAKFSRRDYTQPLMTVFAVGTTGTGKSATAKALALAYYGRSDAMIVLNGGDYVTPSSALEAQHFIGDEMAVNKRQLILLDEIEKSHPTVMDAYMRMIDDGIVRDSNNVERSINTTIVFATSNLGAKIFSDLADNMHLSRQKDPNVLTEGLDEAWFRKEAEVRKALQSGDVGRHNGIKPEFLERFNEFIPYFPHAKKSIANIARMQLETFQNEMKTAVCPINIGLPAKKDNRYWQKQMSTSATPYGDNDELSVMIAEDIIGSEAQTTGARAIARFIEGRVKSKTMRLLAYRTSHNLPVDGQFRLKAANPSFQSNGGARPDVEVEYVPKEVLIKNG